MNTSVMLNFSMWAILQHERINDTYDRLPYWFHLNSTVGEIRQFKSIGEEIAASCGLTFAHLECGGYGHDLLENCPSIVTYTQIKSMTDSHVADICYACTPLRGKNRKEKYGDEFYRVLRETPGASFVKAADTLANIRLSMYTRNKEKLKMYRKEHDSYEARIGDPRLSLMFDKMKQLLYLDI
jgi:(p)ppGpp synthase/HD superfamily hydrolase